MRDFDGDPNRRHARYRAHYTPPAAPDEIADRVPCGQTPERALAAQQRREVLRQLLDELPSAQSEALGLHYRMAWPNYEMESGRGLRKSLILLFEDQENRLLVIRIFNDAGSVVWNSEG